MNYSIEINTINKEEATQVRKVLDKIYQPFFTTKPTGQGTGLDFIKLRYYQSTWRELKVETKEGEGAEFIIQLPFV